MRPLLLLTLALFALPASGQAVLTTTLDLTNEGDFTPDIACAFAYDGAIVWFDGSTESVYAYNDEDETVPAVSEVVSAAAIDAAAGVDADRCRAAAYDPASDVAYFALAASDNVDFILSVGEGEGDALVLTTITSPATGAGDGIAGLAVANDLLYAATYAFFSEPPAGGADALEDGLYSFALEGADQTATAVVTEPDLSLVGLAPTSDGSALFAISNSFGGGDYENKIVRFDLSGDTPSVGVFADPFDGDVFTIPTDDNRRDLTAITVASDGMSEAVFVVNNNFTGPQGEEIARYTLGGDGEIFTSQTGILEDLGRTEPGYTPVDSPDGLLFDELDNNLYIINSSAFGGADEVIVAAPNFATAAEAGEPADLAAFEAAPNPFSDRFTVELVLDQAQDASVAVFDVLGRQVAELHRGPVAAGQRLTLSLNGGALPSGVYLVRLETPSGVATRTVTRVR